MDAISIARVVMLVLFPVTFIVLLKTMYHMWFVVRGVREDKKIAAGLLGPFAFLAPTLFEDRAQPHLQKLSVWLPICIAVFVALFGLQGLVMPEK